MRTLAVLLAVALAAPPAPAAEKNEEKAKEAAAAFLKAVKARDVKAAMKASGLPFVHHEGGKTSVIGDEVAMEFWLEPRFAKIKDADELPTGVTEVAPVAKFRETIKDAALRSWVATAAGKDGFVAKGPKVDPLLVRIKDGKAVVAGIVK